MSNNICTKVKIGAHVSLQLKTGLTSINLAN